MSARKKLVLIPSSIFDGHDRAITLLINDLLTLLKDTKGNSVGNKLIRTKIRIILNHLRNAHEEILK